MRSTIRSLGQEHGRRPFGMCPSCLYLRGDGSCVEGRPPYECGFLDEPLEEAELDQLCDMKKRGLRSPDEADALAPTFALPMSH